ncbi:hypothetical protein KR044_012399 [Drosophila immigrans]|nr:hypothetical protein KR044_012399 [Drosophila immigrans]
MIKLNFVCVLAAAFVIALTQLETLSDAVPLQHIQDLRKHPDLLTSISNQKANLVLKNTGLDKVKSKVNVQPALTTKLIQFMALAMKRQGEGDDDAAPDPDGDADAGSGQGSDDTSAGGNGTSGGNATNTGHVGPEMTISVPKYQKDSMGNWVYHKWGATYGSVWGDTRFNTQFTMPRIRIDSNASINYYPDGPRSTVCLGSTIYNVPRVKNWLKRNVYTEVLKHRPFLDPLRKQLYKQGRSEECHDAIKYAKWQDYQECAMKRNQRMEYYIPKYPLHQLGYRKTATGV